MRVNNRPSDVIAPRDTSVAFKWLLSRLCLDADVDLWNSIKLHGIPYRPNRVVASRSKHPPDPNLSLHLLFYRPPATAIFFAVPKERARSRLLSFSRRHVGTGEVGKSGEESFCHSACARFFRTRGSFVEPLRTFRRKEI